MNIQNYNETYSQNHFHLSSIEKNLNFYLLKDHYLTLRFDGINLNKYESVSVFLKNIKTRETLKCISKIEDNNLILNLRSLNYLCTNYEYSILVILENFHCFTSIYPKFKSKNYIDKSIISSSENSNIQWYLRFLQNGKLRLSTIYLFSKLENEYNNKILL